LSTISHLPVQQHQQPDLFAPKQDGDFPQFIFPTTSIVAPPPVHSRPAKVVGGNAQFVDSRCMRFAYVTPVNYKKILIVRREDRTHGASNWKPASSAFWVNSRTTALIRTECRVKVNKTPTKLKKYLGYVINHVQRVSAKHGVKDDFAFLWEHAIFRHPPDKIPLTDRSEILHNRLRR
jgi:hypothetical protein